MVFEDLPYGGDIDWSEPGCAFDYAPIDDPPACSPYARMLRLLEEWAA